MRFRARGSRFGGQNPLDGSQWDSSENLSANERASEDDQREHPDKASQYPMVSRAGMGMGTVRRRTVHPDAKLDTSEALLVSALAQMAGVSLCIRAS